MDASTAPQGPSQAISELTPGGYFWTYLTTIGAMNRHKSLKYSPNQMCDARGPRRDD